MRFTKTPKAQTLFIRKYGRDTFLHARDKLNEAYDFKTGFLYAYGLWLLVDWYDCFFLDWVLFANVKRIRLPGTEHMDKVYHQKKYHVVRSVIGMALGLVPCLLCALIVAVLG